MDYEEMLSKGREELPQSIFEKDRFEIPNVKGHIEGNKTIISNLNQIASILQRPVEQLFRFLLKELATPGVHKNQNAIFGAKVPASKINDKIRQYANEFVLCHECGKPDTKTEKEGNVTYLKCTACGSRQVIRGRV